VGAYAPTTLSLVGFAELARHREDLVAQIDRAINGEAEYDDGSDNRGSLLHRSFLISYR